MTAPRPHDADTWIANTIAGAPAEAPARGRGAPARIGRFTVLRELGAGGMGVVYAAYDDQLDRKVAVKLLRGAPGHDATEGHTRLLREAQALARLSHPNVVAVFEVGSFEGQVFVAMEFVPGQSLRAWLDAGPRPWRDVVRVFAQAARGLAAAHQAGLVHRDFKPENAIVGDDGRVRVLDFGLARAPTPASDAPMLDPEAMTRSSTLSSTVTVVGAIVGTPAYLAPELWAREAADARSDQFALCVSLWEALYGQRPFRGESMTALAAAICGGAPTQPPAGRRAPAWLHALMLRGLEPDPARRFPSVDALIAALERDPERRRARMIGVGVLLGIVALIALGARNLSATRAQRCTGGAAEIASTWGQEQKDRVMATLATAGPAYAQGTADRAVARLDAYAAAWSAAHRDACEATAVRGEQSQELLDLRMSCLEARRGALAEVAALLGERDAATLEHAVEAVEGLPAIEPCASASYVRAEERLPGTPEAALRAVTARKQLERYRALRRAGRLRDADAQLAALEREGPPEGLRPRLVFERATLDWSLHRQPESAGGFERAYLLARAAGDDRVAREASLRILGGLADGVRTRDVWAVWARIAEVEVERGGDELDRITLLRQRGQRAFGASDFAEARELLTHARERCEREPRCRDAELLPIILRSLGLVFERLRDGPHAIELYREVLEHNRATYGPEHPSTADALDNISAAQQLLGDDAEALKTAKEALELRLRGLGPDHWLVAVSYNNIAGMLVEEGDLAQGIAYYRETVRIEEAHFGPESTQVALTLSNLGNALYELERYDEAREMLQRALKIQRTALTPGHLETMYSLAALGNVERYSERDADAELHLREAAKIAEARFGGGHLHTMIIRRDLAELLISLGHADEAVALTRRNRAEFAAGGDVSDPPLARLDTVLGMAELAAGDELAAEEALRRALVLREKIGEEEDKFDAQVGLGEAVVERDAAEALWLTMRADAALPEPRRTVAQQAALEYVRAVALRRAGSDGSRARAEAAACRAAAALTETPLDSRRRRRLRVLGLLGRCA